MPGTLLSGPETSAATLCSPRPPSLCKGAGSGSLHSSLRLTSPADELFSGSPYQSISLHCYNQERDQLYDHMILEAKNYNKGCYLLVSCKSTSELEQRLRAVTSAFLLRARLCEWLFTYKHLSQNVHNSPVKWVPSSLPARKNRGRAPHPKHVHGQTRFRPRTSDTHWGPASLSTSVACVV